MNMMKFRKVGQPSGDTVSVKIAQKKRAIYARAPESVGLGRAETIRHMLRQGYIPANGGL